MGTHPIFESDFDCLTEMSSKEEIVQGFQNLCQEQRQLQQKLAELRQERGEHELVAETLKKALPALLTQIENINKVITMIEEKMQTKAKEITNYREKHQILVQGQAKAGPPAATGQGRAGVLAQ